MGQGALNGDFERGEWALACLEDEEIVRVKQVANEECTRAMSALPVFPRLRRRYAGRPGPGGGVGAVPRIRLS